MTDDRCRSVTKKLKIEKGCLSHRNVIPRIRKTMKTGCDVVESQGSRNCLWLFHHGNKCIPMYPKTAEKQGEKGKCNVES